MDSLRVLVVHDRCLSPGGEDAVVDAEIGLLRSRGHEVETCIRDVEEHASMRPWRALAQSVWQVQEREDVVRLLEAFRPHVVHAHNTWSPVPGPVLPAAWSARVPVVQTLHDVHRMGLPPVTGSTGAPVPHDAEPGAPHFSRPAAAALIAARHLRRAFGMWRSGVARYIASTETGRRMLIDAGLPASQVAVKPDFADVAPPDESTRRGGLYVGQLGPGSGLETLLEALDEIRIMTLDVIGHGPLAARLQAHPRINLLGRLTYESIRARMRSASYLVLPTARSGRFPRVLIEAFGNGLPIIAAHRGCLLDLVDHGGTGLLFEPGSAEDLARHIAWAETHPEAMRAMGLIARRKYETEYTPERNYERLIAIYDDAIASGTLKTAS